MNPIAFLLLLLLPTIGENRPILPGTRSFDVATDGTFSVPVVRYALSTPLIKNQQTIILKGGTPRHNLRAATGARHATVTDGTLKASKKNLDPYLSVDMLTASLIGINAMFFMCKTVVIGYVVYQENCAKNKKNENVSADTELKTKINKNKVQVLPIEDKKSKSNNDNDNKSWGTKHKSNNV